jgi:hypothetical protein
VRIGIRELVSVESQRMRIISRYYNKRGKEERRPDRR